MAKGGQQQKPSEETAVATVPQPNLPAEYEDSGAGFEGITADELAIPFLIVLQKGHPQSEEGNPAYVEGAKPGMIYNTVTGEMFDGKEKGVVFIPVHRQERWIEWTPREDGGGLVEIYDPKAQIVVDTLKNAKTKFGKHALENGNDLAQTFSLYGLLGEELTPVIIAFASTQIKKYRQWMTTAMSAVKRGPNGEKLVAPLFSKRYRLRTLFEQNKKGTWYGWQIRFDGINAAAAEIRQDSAEYKEAKQFRNMIMAGQVTENREGMTNAVDGAEDENDDRF